MGDKPRVMANHAALLQSRYTFECKTQTGAIMTKGKPQPIGPTVQLKEGMTWFRFSSPCP